MKKTVAIALVLVLTVCLLAGCRSNKPQPSTDPSTQSTAAPTVAPTVRPTTEPSTEPSTQATTGSTQPSDTGSGMDDMLPGSEDTIDPTNGANQSTGPRRRAMPRT